jgi:hypothetical protein
MIHISSVSEHLSCRLKEWLIQEGQDFVVRCATDSLRDSQQVKRKRKFIAQATFHCQLLWFHLSADCRSVVSLTLVLSVVPFVTAARVYCVLWSVHILDKVLSSVSQSGAITALVDSHNFVCCFEGSDWWRQTSISSWMSGRSTVCIC